MKLRSNKIIGINTLGVKKHTPTRHKKGSKTLVDSAIRMNPSPPELEGRTLVFDLETTGIPPRTERGLPEYWRTDLYNSARIVSIAWKVMGQDLETLKDEYYVIRPDGFVIPQSSIAIHGITQEMAEQGECLPVILERLMSDITASKTIVAHNISFDLAVLRSELYRLGWKDAINTSYKKAIVCTMREGKVACKLPKIPRLGELYQVLCGRELTNAHNAQADVDACAECYRALKQGV